MSGTSLGFIEITGVVAAVDALDIMCKTSGVELATWERKLGGRLVTIVVRGDVASVTEAVETAKAKAIKKPVASGIIANPHEEIIRLVNLSASRFMTKDSGSSVEEEQSMEEGQSEEGRGPAGLTPEPSRKSSVPAKCKVAGTLWRDVGGSTSCQENR